MMRPAPCSPRLPACPPASPALPCPARLQVWVYPSEQMFFNAMKRKGWTPSEDDMVAVVAIHNTGGEGGDEHWSIGGGAWGRGQAGCCRARQQHTARARAQAEVRCATPDMHCLPLPCAPLQSMSVRGGRS